MGDERREDRDRARHRGEADSRGRGRDEDPESFDTGHAAVQRRLHAPSPDPRMIPDSPEHAFDGKGDQDELWTRFESYLDAHDVSTWPLALVRDMDGPHRRMAGARLDEIARVTSGGDLLVVAELTSVLPRTALAAALTCDPRPTPAQVRAFLERVGGSDLKNELGDAAFIAALRAAYPGPPIAVLPHVTDLLGIAALASWYLGETPSEQIAMTMIHAASPGATATQLNAIGRGGWMWAFHVTDAITAINWQTIEVYAKQSNQADVARFLQDKVDAYQTTMDRMVEVDADLGHQLDRKRPDADAAIDDLAIVMGLGADKLRTPEHRRKFLAVATTRQIDQATQLAALSKSERLHWLLDGKNVTLGVLRDARAAWPDDDRRDAFDAAAVAKIRKRFPAAAPADVFGTTPDTLYGEATKEAVIRRWIVERGQPYDILQMLTIFPGSTAAMCRWLGTSGGGWGWLDRIGGGVDDHLLRVLVLHCPDPAVVKKIHDELLGDYRDPDSDVVAPEPISASAFGDPNDRLNRGLRYQRNNDLAEAAGELRPEDVAELKRDPEHLQQLLEHTQGKSLVRILYLVDPPLRDLLVRKGLVDAGVLAVPQVSGWLRDRPVEDVVAALSDSTAASNAMAIWPRAPLELFPPLRQPAVLARVLEANPDVLAWIVQHSEPMSALHAIGAAAVARATVDALDEDPSLVDWLPSGQRLDPRERTYLYSLYNVATGRLRQRIKDRIDAEENEEDEDIDERAVGEDRRERNGQAVSPALEGLLEDSSTPIEDILTLCRERAGEAADLVEHNPGLVLDALTRTQQSPLVAFPSVPLAKFLVGKLADWTFDTVPGFVILREAANDGTLVDALAKGLERHKPAFRSWLRQLPLATALSPIEESALKRLCSTIHDAEIARALFRVRFGSSLSDTYDRKEVGRLWGVLERVPQAHVEQGAVSGFYENAKGAKGVEGEYDPSNRGINLEDELVAKTSNNSVYDRAGPTTQMTRDDAKAAFGLDDAQLDQWVRDGRMKRIDDVYEMNPAPQPDRFSGTALHEVGHAVDAMLGSNTELVYGLAGWRQFGDADFDAWAADLGGWDRVAPADKSKIKEAWLVWTNSSQAAGRPRGQLGTLAGYDHPAVAERYAGVGIVDLARGEQGSSDNPFLANGRAYILSGLYQKRYSVPLRTVHAAPSAYSLTAPEEFFAECYMAYYLTSDGTPTTADKKGALLAPWIKKWFDENVDRIGHNPKQNQY